MAVDARPFLTLTTPSGASIKCGRPKLNPLVNGLGGTPGSVTKDTATHTIEVFAALGTPPADLRENVTVTVDVEKGKPAQKFRVLRNGLDRGAGVWKLYVRTETPEVLA